MPPPCPLVARAMRAAMMPSTEWNSELVADLAAERARLCEAEVMGVRRLAATDEAGLLGDEAKVHSIAVTARFGNREDALVDAFGRITVGSMHRKRLRRGRRRDCMRGKRLFLHFGI